MKKMLILALVLIAVPAMAAVTFDASRTGDQVTVTFENDDATMNVRAFALDLEVDGTIVSVDSVNDEYTIYPGSIVIEDGAVTDAGSAVADASYPGTKDGVGSSAITVEMGSLYAADESAPAQSGTLCVFTVSSEATELTITENAIRGGIVMEDPDQASGSVFPVNLDITGGPEPCPMDVSGDGWISPDDLNMILAYLSPHAASGYWVECEGDDCPMDVSGDGWVSPDDLNMILAYLSPHAASGYWVECP